MAQITTAQLAIAKTPLGWVVSPKAGRNYRSPTNVESVRTIYGSQTVGLEFAGARGSAQRFQGTVSIISVRGMEGMDGLVQAWFDEVGVVDRFIISWPQMGGTDYTATAPRLSANAAVGDNSVRLRASTPPPIGRLIQFEGNGKLYRVISAPTTVQTAAYSVGILPNLVKAATSNTQLVTTASGYARMVSKPRASTVNGIVLESTFTFQEALRA